mmetsp:Transcript_3392/g.4590  ORF Transcript_3392/g.4590 Transcript_3392/m.4590 type:complete len:80 (+) Transcript_3392:102-341(+)
MTLWTLLQATVLFLNAGAILNEERFLQKYGWGSSSLHDGSRPSVNLKSQTIGFIHAVSYMRVPLVVLNILIVFVKVIFG